MPNFSRHMMNHLVRTPWLKRCTLVIGAALLGNVPLHSAETSFERDVRPILQQRCFACHGALKQEAELRVDTVSAMLAGGDSGAALERGSPQTSILVERISATDEFERMPPEGEPLTADEIARIRTWIDQGAVAPAIEVPEADPSLHWAFQTPQRPDVPSVDAKRVRNPIDALIAAQRDQRGLTPVDEVAPSLLLRRLYLDLIGLPPTRKQQQQFLADPRATAYEDIVEELLLSPHHGERWGRHWMDVWRYSDWYGLGKQLRNSQKHIWHWRDWIVESLNQDKGYDQMVREMLAADEFSPTDHDALRATGFLARNYYLFNRTTWLDNTVEHTSKSLLGLTLNCAKCHDHKFDPLLQEDYYRMRAVFEPHQVRLDPVPGEIDLEKDGLPRVFDAHLDEPTYIHLRGDAKNPDTSRPIAPGAPALLAGNAPSPTRVMLPLVAHRPELQPFVLEDHLRNTAAKIETLSQAVAEAEQQLAKARAAQADRAARAARLATDGDPDKPPTAPSLAGPVLHDTFDALDTTVWETGPGTWTYADGRLVQTETGATRRYLRTRAPHPQDFVAKLAFKTTGGDKWRSVGVCFDVTEGREKLVYMSAVAGGSKLQLSYKTGPSHTYPDNGRQARPVMLNTRYELEISVRGTLVNVAIDGKHALAFNLPVAREAGQMDLIAFDAAAEFHEFDVRPLAPEVVLVAAGTGAPTALTVDHAAAALTTARLRLAAAVLQPEALRTAHAADLAKGQRPSAAGAPASDDLRQRIRAAALAARKLEAATAEARVAELSAKLAASEAASEKAKLEKELAQARQQFASATEKVSQPGDQYTSIRAAQKAAEGPDETEQSRHASFPVASSGRRSALATWITRRDNPLTARVAVNHIWSRHFGQPLVESVFDFGRRSPAPPQQALLDWLAVELMENNWSQRHIHRLIVTSQTYRLATSGAAAGSHEHQIDPENQYYWRRTPVRMESQVIRDSLLHLAGALDLTLGGPSLAAQANGTDFRRSLYFKHSRDDANPFLSTFDDANILACYRRSESIVPQQALALANSKLALEMARRIPSTFGNLDDGAFVTVAFETLLCRLPTDQERAACSQTLADLLAAATDQNLPEPAQRARANLIHALLNHNDFITVR